MTVTIPGLSAHSRGSLPCAPKGVRAPRATLPYGEARAYRVVRRLLLGVRRQRVEVHARGAVLAALEVDPDHVEARAIVRRIERDRVLQVLLGDRGLSLRERFARAAVLHLARVGNE